MKLFASDFDGTFYFWNKRKQDLEENIRAVKEFQKENKFAFVTGRTPQSLLKNIESYDFKPDYLAGFNGGIICDSNMNIIYEDYPEIDVYKLMNILKNEKIKSFSFFTDNLMFVRFYKLNLKDFAFMNHYSKLNEKKITYRLKMVENLPISMATVVCIDSKQAKIVCDKILQLNMKCNAFINNHCIDIVGVHASKKNAVEIIAKHAGIDDIYTIGDSYNDVSMIEYYHGFTLEHANEDIKQIACHVVDNVSDAIKMLHK